LNTYSKEISEYAEKNFSRNNINLLTNCRVTEVFPKHIEILDKKTNQKSKIEYGLCVWSTGIKSVPLIEDFVSKIPTQRNKHAVTTDNHLKVMGVDDIYAIGDCATIHQERLLSKITEFYENADTNKDGKISMEEFKNFTESYCKVYPQLKFFQENFELVFNKNDINHDNVLDRNEFQNILKEVDSKMTNLPATAQVASQQGRYLGISLNREQLKLEKSPFVYNHQGSMAYIGSEKSVIDVSEEQQINGVMAYFAWRGYYLSQQISSKSMVNIASDWVKNYFFGGDISRN
jgi:NADH dehydrogenase FAD-containing subunit